MDFWSELRSLKKLVPYSLQISSPPSLQVAWLLGKTWRHHEHWASWLPVQPCFPVDSHGKATSTAQYPHRWSDLLPLVQRSCQKVFEQYCHIAIYKIACLYSCCHVKRCPNKWYCLANLTVAMTLVKRGISLLLSLLCKLYAPKTLDHPFPTQRKYKLASFCDKYFLSFCCFFVAAAKRGHIWYLVLEFLPRDQIHVLCILCPLIQRRHVLRKINCRALNIRRCCFLMVGILRITLN